MRIIALLLLAFSASAQITITNVFTGTNVNTRDGDGYRLSFNKLNTNDNLLFNLIQTNSSNLVGLSNHLAAVDADLQAQINGIVGLGTNSGTSEATVTNIARYVSTNILLPIIGGKADAINGTLSNATLLGSTEVESIVLNDTVTLENDAGVFVIGGDGDGDARFSNGVGHFDGSGVSNVVARFVAGNLTNNAATATVAGRVSGTLTNDTTGSATYAHYITSATITNVAERSTVASYVSQAVLTNKTALSNLLQSGANTGNVIKWDGAGWVAGAVSTVAGVSTFEGRDGEVDLTPEDIYLRLGFWPASTNSPDFSGSSYFRDHVYVYGGLHGYNLAEFEELRSGTNFSLHLSADYYYGIRPSHLASMAEMGKILMADEGNLLSWLSPNKSWVDTIYGFDIGEAITNTLSSAGVLSWNSRTGHIGMEIEDITGTLDFMPVSPDELMDSTNRLNASAIMAGNIGSEFTATNSGTDGQVLKKTGDKLRWEDDNAGSSSGGWDYSNTETTNGSETKEVAAIPINSDNVATVEISLIAKGVGKYFTALLSQPCAFGTPGSGITLHDAGSGHSYTVPSSVTYSSGALRISVQDATGGTNNWSVKARINEL